MSELSVEEFENSSEENGVRFWEAHAFMRRLGYETWTSFQSVITKAMGSCAKLNIDPTEVFLPHTVSVEGKPAKSYKLTRFGCFLISMHGDSKKPEVMRARAVLAAIADRLIQEKIDQRDLGRIETREDLRLAEVLMSGVADAAGLEKTQFGIFKNAGFVGMYNMGLQQLKAYKGIPRDSSSVLYDFMGLEELAGNLFRVTQTAKRIQARQVRGLQALSRTAKEVGEEVRGVMMKDGATAPENLPIEQRISEVTKKVKIAHRKMKKFDQSKNNRLLNK